MEMLAFALALATAFPFEIGDVLVPAHLDAGTGSLIFQVLVASLVSAGVVFGGAIVYLRSFFSRVVRRSPRRVRAVGRPTKQPSTRLASTLPMTARRRRNPTGTTRRLNGRVGLADDGSRHHQFLIRFQFNLPE